MELSTRPEYERDGAPGTPGFFRYDHEHAPVVGATRWLTSTIGYGPVLDGGRVAVMPFIELQHSRVRRERGDADPRALFGRAAFWSATAGFRLYLGGGAMRMGSYGALDPMTIPVGGAPPAAHAGH